MLFMPGPAPGKAQACEPGSAERTACPACRRALGSRAVHSTAAASWNPGWLPQYLPLVSTIYIVLTIFQGHCSTASSRCQTRPFSWQPKRAAGRAVVDCIPWCTSVSNGHLTVAHLLCEESVCLCQVCWLCQQIHGRHGHRLGCQDQSVVASL